MHKCVVTNECFLKNALHRREQNSFLFIWKMLADFCSNFCLCSTETTLGWSELARSSLSESGEAGCIFLFWLPLLYLTFSWDAGNGQGPILPHLSNERSWSFWGKTQKCSYRRELNTIIFFPWPLRDLTLNQFGQSSRINTGTKCIFANLG